MTGMRLSCKDGDHSAILQGMYTETCAVQNSHNDLERKMSSDMRIFADDTKLFTVVMVRKH